MFDAKKLGSQNKIANAIDHVIERVRRVGNHQSYGTRTQITTRGTIITPIERFQSVPDSTPTSGSGDTFCVCRWA